MWIVEVELPIGEIIEMKYIERLFMCPQKRGRQIVIVNVDCNGLIVPVSILEKEGFVDIF